MPVYFTTPTQINVSGVTNGTFSPLTAPGVPTTASGVMLQLTNSASHNPIVSFRMTGSGDTIVNTQGIGSGNQATFYTGVSNQSGNMQFDLNTNSFLTTTLWITGYFLATEATFFPAVALTPTLTSSLQTISAAANVPAGSPGAFVDFIIVSTAGPFFIRQTGSSDTFQASSGQAPLSTIIGVDAAQTFQARSGSTGSPTPAQAYLRGYLNPSSGLVWHQNAVSVGGSFSSGVFQNVPLGSTSSAVGAIYSVFGTGQGAVTLAPTGCNTTTYNPQSGLVSQNNSGAGPAVQINPASATQPLVELAYFSYGQSAPVNLRIIGPGKFRPLPRSTAIQGVPAPISGLSVSSSVNYSPLGIAAPQISMPIGRQGPSLREPYNNSQLLGQLVSYTQTGSVTQNISGLSVSVSVSTGGSVASPGFLGGTNAGSNSQSVAFGTAASPTFGTISGFSQSVSVCWGNVPGSGTLQGVAISTSSATLVGTLAQFQPLVPMTATTDVRLRIGYQPWRVNKDDVVG